MKPSQCASHAPDGRVAPYAGAWIETLLFAWYSRIRSSPPTRGRGLKPLLTAAVNPLTVVAPYAGAWIETF